MVHHGDACRATRTGFWVDRVYLSRDASLSSDDQFLGQWGYSSGAPLGVGQSYSPTITVPLPDGASGDYHLIGFTDSNLVGAAPPGPPGIGLE